MDDSDGDDGDDDDDASSSDINPWQKMIGTTYENMQSRFDRRVASYVEDGGIAVAKAERVAAAEMRPDYEWKLRDVYEQRLLFNRALRVNLTHQKDTATAKRLRDEDEYDTEESVRYAVRKRRYLLSKKLDEYVHPVSTLLEEGDDDWRVDEAPAMLYQSRAIINRRAFAGLR
jgi:hypothetical protein